MIDLGISIYVSLFEKGIDEESVLVLRDVEEEETNQRLIIKRSPKKRCGEGQRYVGYPQSKFDNFRGSDTQNGRISFADTQAFSSSGYHNKMYSLSGINRKIFSFIY